MKDSRQRLRLVFVHPGRAARGFRRTPVNQPVCKGLKQPGEDECDYQYARYAQTVRHN